MTDRLVLIVGAGPTGLALALWLTELGVKVRIIDKTVELGTTTRAVAIHARTLEFYRQVGLADAMVEGGRQVAGVDLWTRGTKAMRVPFGRMGEGLSPFPYVLDFPQDLHERLLLDRLGSLGVRVERRTELLRFDQHRDGVRAALKRPDGSEESFDAAYLAGCDGAHSAVRNGLGIGFPGGTYEGLFYVADVEASGPPIDDDIHVDLDQGDFVGVFPYKGSGRVRLIGTVQPESGRNPHEITFDDVRGRAIEHMRLSIARVHWFSTYQVHHRVANGFRAGRAFLLGDAAHIHSPVGGQGMNTGIGDAVNLAWKIAAVLNGGAGDGLLDTYEVERIAFARRLVATTDRAFTLVTKRGAFAQWVRTGVVPRVVPWLFRLPRVRRWAFRALSQIGIHYRGSPVSVGTAGGVRGGDRLPWVRSPAGDNFAPLTSLAWQVHVYGEPRPGVAEACDALRVPLHVFAWGPEVREAGLAQGALDLVRPDGYVALADPGADPERLRDYFRAGGPGCLVRHADERLTERRLTASGASAGQPRD
jgi:2-polyprenyl-6-methoxyphenol hydroxylase-like FAD-dependent oxidoreductase